jgi:hypothetical protein
VPAGRPVCWFAAWTAGKPADAASTAGWTSTEPAGPEQSLQQGLPQPVLPEQRRAVPELP